MNAIGIDPGKSGGVAGVGDRVWALALPRLPGGGLDHRRLATLVAGADVAWVEDQTAKIRGGRPQKGGKTTILGLGEILGVLGVEAVPVEVVPSVTWRRLAGLPHTVPGRDEAARRKRRKAESIALAHRLYPTIDWLPDGPAEALILAHLASRRRRP